MFKIRVLTLVLALILPATAQAIEPVNVNDTFLNVACAQAFPIYEVPKGRLLIIEDASALAVDSESASNPKDPGIVANVPLRLSLRTNPSGQASFGSADHIIVAGIGLPLAGGRTVIGYAAPGTEVLYLVGGCQLGVKVNTSVYFAGELVPYP